jgi:hypothetical protein
MLTKAQIFTEMAPHRLAVLMTKARVYPGAAPGPTPPTNVFEGNAIWDTGATGTVITQKVIVACGLKATGIVKTNTANGEYQASSYLVNVVLPNSVGFANLKVTEGNLGVGGPDILIGMDIIGGGDFAVTNYGGKTTFSFRLPSMETIDFRHSSKMHVSRNDPCPCHSGKKFKECCKPKV